MAIVTSWSLILITWSVSFFFFIGCCVLLLKGFQQNIDSRFLPVGVFQSAQYLVLCQTNGPAPAPACSSFQRSCADWTACCCPGPHEAFSFWLQLLSVLLWAAWPSFWRPSCCSLARGRLGLTGRTRTTRMQRRCKPKYQDLAGGADHTWKDTN